MIKEQDLFFYLGSSSFRGLQVFHQFRVSQEVSRCRGQAGQQVVLQRLQSDLKAVLLLGQVRLRDTETFRVKTQQIPHLRGFLSFTVTLI